MTLGAPAAALAIAISDRVPGLSVDRPATPGEITDRLCDIDHDGMTKILDFDLGSASERALETRRWIMRRFLVSLAVLAVGLAGFAVAAPAATIAVKEQGTGLSSISVVPGASATFDVILDTEGIATIGYSTSIRWDGGATALLINATATAFKPPGFDAQGAPGITVVQSADGVQGTGDDYDAIVVTSAPFVGTAAIGTITVTAGAVLGVTTMYTMFGTGEGVLDSSGLLTLPTTHVGATISIIPEPATGGLLVLGLAGLVVAAGRRSRA